MHPYPISIEWPPPALRDAAVGGRAPRTICERFGLPPDIKLAVGVERLDYTKGILDRFLALDEFFHQHSEWIGQHRLPADRGAQPRHAARLPAAAQECLDYVADLNERYGSDGYQPIVLLGEHHDQDELVRCSTAPPMSAWSAACTTA